MRLEKILLLIICGAALGVSGCGKGGVRHPVTPPPDVAADAETEGTAAPPEDSAVVMYGAVPPEMEDQPMYGVPTE